MEDLPENIDVVLWVHLRVLGLNEMRLNDRRV